MNLRRLLFFFLLFAGAASIACSQIRLSPKEKNIVSPWVEGGREAINLWLPQDVLASDSYADAPQITAKSAYFVDMDSGQVLYAKNPYMRLSIASVTKIMTLIVTLENHNFSDQIPVSETAANMEPDHMELRAGEKLSVEELTYGIFLVSANDAAEALAENTDGGVDNFVKAMNEKAKMLGMNDTLFINPTGLEEDKNPSLRSGTLRPDGLGKEQYSTAFDVALMSRYAIKQFPHLVDLSSTYHEYIPATANHQDYDLYSGINLLTTYPGVMGFKMGFTPQAGYTSVTLAQKGGHWVIGVILNSDDRRDEARELLDYSFKKLGVKS